MMKFKKVEMDRLLHKDPARSQNDVKKTIGEGLNFATSEAFRLLRTNLLFALPFSSLREGESCRIVGVTSSVSGEGKSTTALNLGYVLAESGKNVLVVEADMRLPTICSRLKLEGGMGLSSLLAGLCTEEEAIRPSGIHDRLTIMASGPTPPNPTELLGSERMKTTLRSVANNYDFVILDLPPMNEVSDALVTSRLTHGMIVVVRQNYATRSSVGEAMRQLDNVGVKVLGFVMTYSSGHDEKYGKYGGYYRRYAYGHARSQKGPKK